MPTLAETSLKDLSQHCWHGGIGIAAKVSIECVEGRFRLRRGYIMASDMGEVLIVPAKEHSDSKQNCRTIFETVKVWPERLVEQPYPCQALSQLVARSIPEFQ
jgi:hypothetical protein